MSASTPFPLGVFVGGLNGSDPSAEAQVDARYVAFTQTLGAAPRFMDAYIDQRQPVVAWASNAGWTAWSWAQSPISRSTIPVIGLPMATAADSGNPDAAFRAFAAGTYDDALRGVVRAWAAQGFPTMYVRPGYEANIGGMPWYTGTDPQVQADFVAAFQHIASVLRSVPNTDVKIVWNPNIASGNAMPVTKLYPGDAAVDVIAGDIYSPMYPRDLYDWSLNNGTYATSFAQWAANPVNRIHYWTYPDATQYGPAGDGQSNTFSLQNMIDFARAHGKPIGIAETGAGGDGTRGPVDDPAFPQWLAGTLANSGAKVAFVNIWDISPGDGNWDFSAPSAPKPAEAAAWGKYFGPATPAIVVGGGPDVIALNVSEDAFRGDAQFTVSVDGVMVGGVLTATQSHAAGQTQELDIQGSFGAGPHAVTVRFLNDAWAGSAALDRNLYVDQVSYDGSSQTGPALFANGARTIGVIGASALPDGQDTLTLRLSEDAYRGDAQFSVTVDGRLVGSPQSVIAARGSGGQIFSFAGSFGAGAHRVGIAFLNDAWGGSAAQDRNLYIEGVAINGVSATAPEAAQRSNGSAVFTVPTRATGPDTLTFHLAEDAYAGDAQCLVSIDGTQLGGVRTVTASHALGQSDQLTFTGDFGAGPHTVAVRFLNDAYGGLGLDRNLYLNAVDFDGARYGAAAAALQSAGAASFTIPAASGPALPGITPLHAQIPAFTKG